MSDIKLLATRELINELMARHPDGAVFVALKNETEDDTTYSIRYTNKYCKAETLTYEQYEGLSELVNYAQAQFDKKYAKIIEKNDEVDDG